MQARFNVPRTDTKDKLGTVGISYAFRIEAELGAREVSPGPRGGRVYQPVLGGTVTGRTLSGSVYPASGADYGLVRSDGVEDVLSRFMIRDAKGEWLYVEHEGYRRPDGYVRLNARFDADAGGPYAWLNDAVMIARVTERDAGRRATIDYFQAI